MLKESLKVLFLVWFFEALKTSSIYRKFIVEILMVLTFVQKEILLLTVQD